MKIRHALFLLACTAQLVCHAEDGSDLWLRYKETDKAHIETNAPDDPTVAIAVDELTRYCGDCHVTLTLLPCSGTSDNGYKTSGTGDRGYVIEADSPLGLLYGSYGLLRDRSLGKETAPARIQKPFFGLRLLNHWDNPDGTVERGYAGQSIWKWEQIDTISQTMQPALAERLKQYARANASTGINGTVLNNVNAKPGMLTREYLIKAAVIANLLRPYGIRVYLSVNFASPMALGYTSTADPLDSGVAEWWKSKADEIYTLIPDFGGFLVKANSEGQPGPGDYGRSHAEGANMLATALKPHGGIVMWRSFVYGANHKNEDRVKQAVSEFKPMDGKFMDNVILQSKNGPLDFQPREPYAPIFDNISATPQMAELQITQEYLGQSRHLVYLAPMWKEFFGFVSPSRLVGIAGVANTGDDTNWCGHPFSQANWYAFGRLAWDPTLTSEDIAAEWIGQTFGNYKQVVEPLTELMCGSRETCVDYMMPLGLHHIFKFDHHYGPEPDGYKPEYPIEWCPVYYHKADAKGIGFERTHAKGTDAVSQYRQPYRDQYESLKTCPDEYLLWFHHVPWKYRMRNGKTLWKNLKDHYNRGVDQVWEYHITWKKLEPYIDEERFEQVDRLLTEQYVNAKEWRDTCLDYFGRIKKGKK